MQVDIQELTPVEREMTVVLEYAELKPHFDQAYRAQQQKVSIKGFRPGKAPIAMVKKLYGREVEFAALERVADRVFRQQAIEQQLPIIGSPSLVDMSYQPDQPYTFKVRYEVPPVIELADLSGLTAERLTLNVTDVQVDEALENLRRSRGQLVETDQPADEHGTVTCDLVRLNADGQPVDGQVYPGQRINLAGDKLNPLLREALIGATVGELRTVDLTFKRSDGAEVLDDEGNRDIFQLTVTKVERLELPEVDDTFADQVSGGQFVTLDALRDDIGAQLSKQFGQRSDEMIDDRLASQVVELHPFVVPSALTNAMLDSFLEDVKRQGKDGKLPADFDEKAFRDANRQLAENRAKWMLLRDKIAQTEGLTATDESVDALIVQQATEMNLDPERMRSFYQNPRNRVGLEDQLLSRQVFELLRNRATITERDATNEVTIGDQDEIDESAA